MGVMKSVLLILILNFWFVIVPLTSKVQSISEHGAPRSVDPNYVDEIDFTSLWQGGISTPTLRQKMENGIDGYKLTMVISHCDKSLEWIWRDFVPHQLSIPNVIVYSKCGNAVEGAPPGTTVVKLPNVGRCDHTFAHHMARMNFTNITSHDETIIFIKDNDRRMKETRSLENLLHITSVNGFGCVEQLLDYGRFRPSYYHDYSTLSTFSLGGWIREDRDKNDEFKSQYENLEDWMDQIQIQLPLPLVPVCYGGTFAATASQISKKKSLWKRIENSLSRGNNIEEGHFCERVWAGLLSKPLSKYGTRIIKEKSAGVKNDNSIFCGTLGYNKPVIYPLFAKIFIFNTIIILVHQVFFKVLKRKSKN